MRARSNVIRRGRLERAGEKWAFRPEGDSAGMFLGGVYGYAAAGLFYAIGSAAGIWPAAVAAAWLGAAAGIWFLPRFRRELRIEKDLEDSAPWWSL